MLHLQFTDGIKTYTQISKKDAEKRFVNGETICITPSNMRPCGQYRKGIYGAWSGGFSAGMEISKYELDDPSPNEDFWTYFDTICTLFMHSNCSYETGYYIRYYAISENQA